jgi:hypothetical protein
MTAPPPITKTHGRLHHADGSFADTFTFFFSANGLRFLDIDQSDPQVKLKDIAHFCCYQARKRGESEPVIIAFLQLEQDRPAARLFPDIPTITPDGETLLSARSFITHTLRRLLRREELAYRGGQWQTDSSSGRAVIQYLLSQNRLRLDLGYGRRLPDQLDFPAFPINHNLVPIGRCGFLSDFAWRERPLLAFASAFFLLESDDFCSHHSALGEAYNLWAAEGVIRRPPLYRRGAIFYQDGRWRVGFLGMNDLAITLPIGVQLSPHDVPLPAQAIPFTLNDEGPSDLTLYTRYHGVASEGQVLGCTPAAPGRFELSVVDRRVVGWKLGGGLELPQNGLVISFAPGTLSAAQRQELQQALRERNLLDYRFARPQHLGISQALQVGPLLLQDGHSPLTNTYLEEKEQFWPSRPLADGGWKIGVVSTDYKTDMDRTRHGRAGLGIDGEGNLVLVMVACVKPAVRVPEVESAGATLSELVHLLREAGAVDAVNLDGGGSTQAYFMGGRVIVPGDRRGLPLVQYERMVPSVGAVW